MKKKSTSSSFLPEEEQQRREDSVLRLRSSAILRDHQRAAALRGAGLSDADVAPAGDAFALVAAERRDVFVRLYNPNAVHPSVGGTYLAAAVLYAALTRRDVRHLNVPSCAPEAAPCAMALRPAEDTYLRDVAARAVEMARASLRAVPCRHPLSLEWHDHREPPDEHLARLLSPLTSQRGGPPVPRLPC